MLIRVFLHAAEIRLSIESFRVKESVIFDYMGSC